jgi:hypothetical protein
MGVSDQRRAPVALYPRERSTGIHWIGGWVGLRAGLHTEARGEILYLCWMVGSLFNDAFSVTRLRSIYDRMISE